MKKYHLKQVQPPKHSISQSNKQNLTFKRPKPETHNYLDIMNKNNSLVLLDAEKYPSRGKLHIGSCNSSSKRSRNLNRQISEKKTLELPKIETEKGRNRLGTNKLPSPLKLSHNSYNIKEMLGRIFDEKKQQFTIDQEFSKLNHLTKRYSLLRKELVTIQENIISMNLGKEPLPQTSERYF